MLALSFYQMSCGTTSIDYRGTHEAQSTIISLCEASLPAIFQLSQVCDSRDSSDSIADHHKALARSFDVGNVKPHSSVFGVDSQDFLMKAASCRKARASFGRSNRLYRAMLQI